ncbi:hypothetical protein [Eubacterium ruminantium]|uniref:hypothetical protein n=1 Tax=Eubacterium ruminantium TaxID=42322 RepID=UPI001568FFAB|nr:hypothetical protein [Eubacterium ruminantium]
MSIYRQIKDNFIMKNAWNDWASYREKLTDLIVSKNSGSVMIVGAGRCNDIDLKMILQTFDKVIMIDVDEEGVREAAAGFPESLRKKIDIMGISLTGIYEDEVEDFCEEMTYIARTDGMNGDKDHFVSKLRSYMDHFEEKLERNIDELNSLFSVIHVDVTVSCGVHSQLFSMISIFIKILINNLSSVFNDMDRLEAEMEERLRHMNDMIIPVINRALYNSSKEKIYFGNEYMPDSPVEGADQCIRDVRDRYSPSETQLIWDFNPAEEKKYNMLIQICGVNRDLEQ